MFELKQLLQVPLVLFRLELWQCESGWRQFPPQRARKGTGSSKGGGSGSKEQGKQQGRVAAAVCQTCTAQLSPPAQMPYSHHTNLPPQQYQKSLNQTPKY